MFGLDNTINTYLRYKIHVGEGICNLKCVLAKLAMPNLSLIYLS